MPEGQIRGKPAASGGEAIRGLARQRQQPGGDNGNTHSEQAGNEQIETALAHRADAARRHQLEQPGHRSGEQDGIDDPAAAGAPHAAPTELLHHAAAKRPPCRQQHGGEPAGRRRRRGGPGRPGQGDRRARQEQYPGQ